MILGFFIGKMYLLLLKFVMRMFVIWGEKM